MICTTVREFDGNVWPSPYFYRSRTFILLDDLYSGTPSPNILYICTHCVLIFLPLAFVGVPAWILMYLYSCSLSDPM